MRLLMLILLLIPSLSTWSFNLAPEKIPFAVTELSFSSQPKQHVLSEYKGKKVMLWLFSTWCHTCVASVRAMQKQQALWQQQGLVILALRNYQNGGYPGVSMKEFMQRFGPETSLYWNWVTGEASKQMDKRLNSRKFPDIYFLIDEKGYVQKVSTAPNRTMKLIVDFINGTVQ